MNTILNVKKLVVGVIVEMGFVMVGEDECNVKTFWVLETLMRKNWFFH